MKLERMIANDTYVGTAEKNGEGNYSVSVYRKAYNGKAAPSLAHLPAYDMLSMTEQAASDWIKACFASIAIAAQVEKEIA